MVLEKILSIGWVSRDNKLQNSFLYEAITERNKSQINKSTPDLEHNSAE